MGLNLVKYERTYFWTGMPSLSRGGANSYFWGRYAPPKKRTPKPCPVNGTVAPIFCISVFSVSWTVKNEYLRFMKRKKWASTSFPDPSVPVGSSKITTLSVVQLPAPTRATLFGGSSQAWHTDSDSSHCSLFVNNIMSNHVYSFQQQITNTG
jgi:hypothetical protein